MSDSLPFHPAPAVLADYQARRLPPAEVLAVNDHLAGCDACRETLRGLSGPAATEEMDWTDETDGAPTYAEIAALLDGELDPGQVAALRRRLDAEPFLAAEFADLEAFRRETAALPPKLHGPLVGGQRRNPLPGETPPAHSPGNVIPFPIQRRVALAAAAMLLLSAGWWVVSPGRGHSAGPLWQRTDGRPLALADLPLDLRPYVERAAATGEIDLPAPPATLRPGDGTLAGEPPAAGIFSQISPVGETVRETRPRLRWNPCPGAAGYTVSVVSLAAPDAVQTQELPGDRTDWTSPTPLVRGAVYEWQIEATAADGKVIDRAPKPPAAEARFQVLSVAGEEALSGVEKRFASSPLVLGTAYLHAGLPAEAAKQFHQLAQMHPDSSVARRLEQSARQLSTRGDDSSQNRPAS